MSAVLCVAPGFGIVILSDLPQGLTEPNHGSDPAGMETTAVETDGGFIIDGSKTWISNAPYAYVTAFHTLLIYAQEL